MKWRRPVHYQYHESEPVGDSNPWYRIELHVASDAPTPATTQATRRVSKAVLWSILNFRYFSHPQWHVSLCCIVRFFSSLMCHFSVEVKVETHTWAPRGFIIFDIRVFSSFRQFSSEQSSIFWLHQGLILPANREGKYFPFSFPYVTVEGSSKAVSWNSSVSLFNLLSHYFFSLFLCIYFLTSLSPHLYFLSYLSLSKDFFSYLFSPILQYFQFHIFDLFSHPHPSFLYRLYSPFQVIPPLLFTSMLPFSSLF